MISLATLGEQRRPSINSMMLPNTEQRRLTQQDNAFFNQQLEALLPRMRLTVESRGNFVNLGDLPQLLWSAQLLLGKEIEATSDEKQKMEELFGKKLDNMYLGEKFWNTVYCRFAAGMFATKLEDAAIHTSFTRRMEEMNNAWIRGTDTPGADWIAAAGAVLFPQDPLLQEIKLVTKGELLEMFQRSMELGDVEEALITARNFRLLFPTEPLLISSSDDVKIITHVITIMKGGSPWDLANSIHILALRKLVGAGQIKVGAEGLELIDEPLEVSVASTSQLPLPPRKEL